MDLHDVEIYKGKTFAALCKEIVVNQNEKKDQLDILISELRTLIKTTGDALMMVPLITAYLEVGVRNDEQLVKLAAVIQRIIARQNEPTDDSQFAITDEEKKQLLAAMDVGKSSSVKIQDIK